MPDPIEDLFAYKDDQDKGAVVFKDIRKTINRQLQESVDNYKWDGKLHPSSLCFNMCPKTFIQKEIHKKENKGIKMCHLGNDGSSSHRNFQNVLLAGNILYPDLPSFRHVNVRHKLDWLEKIMKNFPEVPVKLEIAKGRRGKEEVFLDLSGICDSVIEVRKKPVIQDFKFKYPEDGGKEKWEKMKEHQLPLDKDITQITVYAYVINLLKYYKEDILDANLSYYCKALLGKQEAEHEVFIDLRPLLPMVEVFFSEFAEHWVDLILGNDNPCGWEYCSEHGKGWSYRKTTSSDNQPTV